MRAASYAAAVAAFLVILGNRDGLRWVLENERMAFPGRRDKAAESLAAGDELLLYTTRGCFGNPGRDLGRVIGRARAATPVQTLDKPVEVAGREFSSGCKFELTSLAPFGSGVALTEHVHELAVFPDPASWSAWLRRPLLRLPFDDARLLLRELKPLAGPPSAALRSYS